MFRYGLYLGTHDDQAGGERWLRLAAEMRHSDATATLGVLLHEWGGTPRPRVCCVRPPVAGTCARWRWSGIS